MEHSDETPEINADLLLKAYMCGVFPMAETRDATHLYWVDPKKRGVLPLDQFHLSSSLKKTILKAPFRVTVNSGFDAVMRACAAPRENSEESWINDQILELYQELHQRGFAHSVECWEGEDLVGGLYGVCINGAYFGESMFHHRTDASKIALAYLVARLKKGGFKLLDTQFVTAHLKTLGVIEIDRSDYLTQLERALLVNADFYSLSPDASPSEVVQLITQTS